MTLVLRPLSTAASWNPLYPSALRWDLRQPADPDLQLCFRLPQGCGVRLEVQPALGLVQRLLRKPLLLELQASRDEIVLWVTLGLSALYGGPASLVEPWLRGLVRLEVGPGRPAQEGHVVVILPGGERVFPFIHGRLALSQYAPVRLCLPLRA